MISAGDVDRYGDYRPAVFKLAGIESVDENMHIRKLDSDVSEKSRSVDRNDLQSAAERLTRFDLPVSGYPALGLFALADVVWNVCTSALVDRHAVAASDVSDDFITRKRIAAI